jgi:hypothetical protein
MARVKDWWSHISKKRRLVLVIALVAVAVVAVGGLALWEYHENPQFCGTCHIMQTYVESWKSEPFLAYAHAEAGVTCLMCHEPTIQQQVDEVVKFVTKDYETPLSEREFPNEFCFGCHEHGSYAEVSQRTAGLALNPHDSHFGERDCTLCHNVHRDSQDYCAPCHGPVATGTGWVAATGVAEWSLDADCALCHPSNSASLQNPDMLANVHTQQNLACVDCHGAAFLQQVHEAGGTDTSMLTERLYANDLCFGCHVSNEHTSYQQVSARTADYTVGDQKGNPHDSHFGEKECGLCHNMHRASEDQCAPCHGAVAAGAGWVIPTLVIEWSPEVDCALCHPFHSTSLQDTNLLGNFHTQQDLVCLDCHDSAAMQPVHAGVGTDTSQLTARDYPNEVCFDCHVSNEHTSYQQVVGRTKDYAVGDQKMNPHDSHFGETECNLCHNMHRASEDYCAPCHGPVAAATGWVGATLAVEWSPDVECAICHPAHLESLQDTYMLVGFHAQQGLTCLDCHDAVALQNLHAGVGADTSQLKERWYLSDFCVGCHVPNEHTSYQQIIDRTEDYTIDDEEVNPHNPHEGSELMGQEQFPCYYCHKMHNASPGIEGCYGCHHERTLESCTVCHE